MCLSSQNPFAPALGRQTLGLAENSSGKDGGWKRLKTWMKSSGHDVLDLYNIYIYSYIYIHIYICIYLYILRQKFYDTVDGSEILHQLICSLSHYLQNFYTLVVQDFWTINRRSWEIQTHRILRIYPQKSSSIHKIIHLLVLETAGPGFIIRNIKISTFMEPTVNQWQWGRTQVGMKQHHDTQLHSEIFLFINREFSRLQKFHQLGLLTCFMSWSSYLFSEFQENFGTPLKIEMEPKNHPIEIRKIMFHPPPFWGSSR